MCRNIKQLRRSDGDPTDAELQAAALQFVRKISGYRVPSQTNREAFDLAIAEITLASRRLFDDLVVRPSPAAQPADEAAPVPVEV